MGDLIFLIGYRGVGKTTIGRKLAAYLQYAFVDTDAEIVRRTGKTITALVGNEGWKEFRRLEEEVLVSLKDVRRTVAATGGGAILHRRVWQQLRRRGIVFWLTAETETLLQRLGADPATDGQRPPLAARSPAEEIAAVMAERRPLYEMTAHRRLDTTGLSEDALAGLIGDILQREFFPEADAGP